MELIENKTKIKVKDGNDIFIVLKVLENRVHIKLINGEDDIISSSLSIPLNTIDDFYDEVKGDEQ